MYVYIYIYYSVYISIYIYIFLYIYISILIYSGSQSEKMSCCDSNSADSQDLRLTVCGFPRGTSAAKTAPKTAAELMSSRCQSQWVRMRFFSSVRKKDRNHMWSPTSDVCDTSLW
jgi:hypothetical protein